MRRHFPIHPLLLIAVASCTAGAGIAAGCSATESPPLSSTTGTGGQGGNPTSASSTASSSSQTGAGGIMTIDAGDDAPPDTFMNPCGTQCGPDELCDPAHLGLDDDCDDEVDETCPCSTGQAHFCFKGDPSYHNVPGCFDGTQKCTEFGIWGPCNGGIHVADGCYMNNLLGCHAISAVPFADVDLKDGTGTFSSNAVPGTEVWTVACPSGINPCPMVGGSNPPDDFKPLQSGEYTVTYTKGIPGGGTDSCTYPLFVGAPGLRVELEWEHDLGSDGVDLDLHVLQPNSGLPWSISGSPQDCTWVNCVQGDFAPPQNPDSPNWFSNTGTPPTPLNWYLDPAFERNTCYFAPRGVGIQWQALGLGCHNPRLDLDNIYCDPNIVDPNDSSFCAPENINIDYPPLDEWIRVGVHYYSSHSLTYDVHPRIKIYCDGALAGELGPAGFYDPVSPITFQPSDGDGSQGGNRFWVVADVAFRKDVCDVKSCVVQPTYSDPTFKTPFLILEDLAQNGFAPPYPPLPP